MTPEKRELLDLAKSKLRDGNGLIDVVNEIELTADAYGWNPMTIVGEARTELKNEQDEAFKEAVTMARNGESHFRISKCLQARGFHPYDADCVAARAQEAAAEQK